MPERSKGLAYRGKKKLNFQQKCQKIKVILAQSSLVSEIGRTAGRPCLQSNAALSSAKRWPGNLQKTVMGRATEVALTHRSPASRVQRRNGATVLFTAPPPFPHIRSGFSVLRRLGVFVLSSLEGDCGYDTFTKLYMASAAVLPPGLEQSTCGRAVRRKWKKDKQATCQILSARGEPFLCGFCLAMAHRRRYVPLLVLMDVGSSSNPIHTCPQFYLR